MTKDLSNGLVLDLDISTGQDYSGNNNDGIFFGTTLTTDKYGRLNKARSFDGSSYLTIPDDSSLDITGEISIALDVYMDTTSTATNALIGKREATEQNGAWDIILRGNSEEKVGFRIYSGSGSGQLAYSTAGSFLYDKWNRVLITRNDSTTTTKFYVNGILINTDTSITNILSNTTHPLYIGWNGQDAKLVGDITKPKIWNRVLSAEEVQQDYAEISHNYAGLFDGLVAGYDFRGDAKDFSGNGNDGTVTGATLTTDQFGIENSAYTFNGTSGNYISTPDFPLKDGTTIHFKYKTNNAYLNMRFFEKGNTGAAATSDIILAYKSTGAYELFLGGGGTAYTRKYGGSVVNTDTWTIVSIVIHSITDIDIYENGEPISLTDGSSGVPTSYVNTTRPLWIGGSEPYSTLHYNGEQSNFIIQYKDSTAADVKAFVDLLSKGDFYPYPQQRQGGILE